MTTSTISKRCPWCNAACPAKVTRACSAATEWRCSSCGMTWVVKVAEPNETYAFYPPDIEAALDNDIEPLDLGIP